MRVDGAMDFPIPTQHVPMEGHVSEKCKRFLVGPTRSRHSRIVRKHGPKPFWGWFPLYLQWIICDMPQIPKEISSLSGHPLQVTKFSSLLGSSNVVPAQSSVTNATAEDLHEHTSEAASHHSGSTPLGNLLQLALHVVAMALP